MVRASIGYVWSGRYQRFDFFLYYHHPAFSLNTSNMSPIDNEDLIDYDDEENVPNGAAAPAATNGAASTAGADGEDKDKKNFSGIHSTGFR